MAAMNHRRFIGCDLLTRFDLSVTHTVSLVDALASEAEAANLPALKFGILIRSEFWTRTQREVLTAKTLPAKNWPHFERAPNVRKFRNYATLKLFSLKICES